MSVTKFLKFGGGQISYLSKNGIYWIALPPILDYLEMSQESRSLKDLKKDPILGPARSILTLQVSKNGRKQGRPLTCLPEHLIYGWIFTLPNNSEEIITYKKECYDILYQHFHGSITGRKELILQRAEVDLQIAEKEKDMKENDPNYKDLKNLKNKRKNISEQLNNMDKEIIVTGDLFNQPQE